jgi:hypothetical protein
MSETDAQAKICEDVVGHTRTRSTKFRAERERVQELFPMVTK